MSEWKWSVAILVLQSIPAPAAGPVLVPQVEGEWWQVAGDPDLGMFTSPKQQPVDFAVWQAADGFWRLWSCIRSTACGGQPRLFHRWRGARLTGRDWPLLGIAMRADPARGDAEGGLQAPHVVRVEAEYYTLYGGWENICLAESVDGKTFARQLMSPGKSGMFGEDAGNNTRDPMVLRVGKLFHLRRVRRNRPVFGRVPVRLLSCGVEMLLPVPNPALRRERANERLPLRKSAGLRRQRRQAPGGNRALRGAGDCRTRGADLPGGAAPELEGNSDRQVEVGI